MSSKGLGGSDPFARREAASKAFLPPRPAPEPVQTSSNTSREIARDDRGEAPMTDSTLSAPPARSRQDARDPLNVRVDAELLYVFKRYVRDHDSTLQAGVDHMFREYLGARGLWPPAT